MRVTHLMFWMVFGGLLSLPGYAKHPQPDDVDNICSIFKQYPRWYWAARDSQIRWQVPVATQMAIIYQESRFKAGARPPRKKLLGIVPWRRPSSAYGYTQALAPTWGQFEQSTGQRFASPRSFSDSVQFVGWYAYMARRKAGIASHNTYELYLAYHEGVNGYLAHSYRRKPWLMHVARKVQQQSERYKIQLDHCQQQLARRPWWRWWS